MRRDTAAVSEFDLIVICLLSVSGLIGCVRGAAREVMTVLAFVLGVLVSLFSVRFVGPVLRHVVHPAWAANSMALLVVFVAVYVGVRMAVAQLAHGLRHMDSVSLIDRLLGLGFGVARGLVVLGAFQLLLSAASPGARPPNWMADATLYPLAMDSGHALALLAPQGSAMAKQLAPTVERAVASTPDAPPSDQPQEKPQ